MFCEVEDCFGTMDKLKQVLQALYFLCSASHRVLHGASESDFKPYMQFACTLPAVEPDCPDMKGKWQCKSEVTSLDGLKQCDLTFSGHRLFGRASAVYFNVKNVEAATDAYKAVWLPEVLDPVGEHVMAKELEVMQVLREHLPDQFKNRIPELRGWAHESRRNTEEVMPEQRDPNANISKRHLWIISMSRGALIELATVRNIGDFVEVLKDTATSVSLFFMCATARCSCYLASHQSVPPHWRCASRHFTQQHTMPACQGRSAD